MNKSIGLISVIKRGDDLGVRIREGLIRCGYESVELFTGAQCKELGLSTLTQNCFESFGALVFISSTGIAVRSIGNLLKDKKEDPGVVVVDTNGNYAISLAGGHLGGANELALSISEEIGCQAVITTATDGLGIEAPDMIAKNNDLFIEDMKICKDIAAFLVNGEKVAFYDESGDIGTPRGYVGINEEHRGIVTVDLNKNIFDEKTHLRLFRRNIVLGIGCRKDYDSEKMKKNVMNKLQMLEIPKERIRGIVSIDIKKNEKAIISLAQYLEVPFEVYTKEEIQKVHHKYHGSDFVEKITGVRAVAEPVIELSGGDIISGKEKMEGMTLAVGIL